MKSNCDKCYEKTNCWIEEVLKGNPTPIDDVAMLKDHIEAAKKGKCYFFHEK